MQLAKSTRTHTPFSRFIIHPRIYALFSCFMPLFWELALPFKKTTWTTWVSVHHWCHQLCCFDDASSGRCSAAKKNDEWWEGGAGSFWAFWRFWGSEIFCWENSINGFGVTLKQMKPTKFTWKFAPGCEVGPTGFFWISCWENVGFCEPCGDMEVCWRNICDDSDQPNWNVRVVVALGSMQRKVSFPKIGG